MISHPSANDGYSWIDSFLLFVFDVDGETMMTDLTVTERTIIEQKPDEEEKPHLVVKFHTLGFRHCLENDEE